MSSAKLKDLPVVTIREETYPSFPAARPGRFICLDRFVLTLSEAEELARVLNAAIATLRAKDKS